MSVFSDNLKRLRGPTPQSQFAIELGMKQQQYARYEKGLTVPSIDVLAEICRVHACSADWLLGLKDSNDTSAVKPQQPMVNLEELRTTAKELADQSTALSGTIKKLKKML